MPPVLRHADTLKLKSDIAALLATPGDDAALMARLEGLAAHPKFGALGWYWAPRLYRRDKVRFRPFVLQHLADFAQWRGEKRWHFEALRWEGEVATELDPWLAELDRSGDVALFRRLYTWRHRSSDGWGVDASAWQRDLRMRFTRAASAAQRAAELDKLDLPRVLDEATAQALYAHDPVLAAPFILRKLPLRFWAATPPYWSALIAQAQARGDTAFRSQLYRRMVPLSVWQRDALALCRTVEDPALLRSALELHHPVRRWRGVGEGLARILAARDLDVMPYIRAHLRDVVQTGWDSGGYTAMEKLARERGWVDLRIALALTCANPKAYNRAVAEVLDDRGLHEAERRRRLAMLSGVSREWHGAGWGLAAVQQLEQALALRLYERHPDLVRSTFKAQILPAWSDTHAELFERAWAHGDDEMVDHLMSRYATRVRWGDAGAGPDEPVVARAAHLLESLQLAPASFARRAAGILTRMPAHCILSYRQLLRSNRLARLLFERALPDFLADAQAVRNLVEGPEIHVQRLAYRVLSLRDTRARVMARENLDILIGTLLRPLHRETRTHALHALDNAASSDIEARQVLARARDALALPDRRYPKEPLVGLIGRVLARYPALAQAGEQPVVYRRAPAGALAPAR